LGFDFKFSISDFNSLTSEIEKSSAKIVPNPELLIVTSVPNPLLCISIEAILSIGIVLESLPIK